MALTKVDQTMVSDQVFGRRNLVYQWNYAELLKEELLPTSTSSSGTVII